MKKMGAPHWCALLFLSGRDGWVGLVCKKGQKEQKGQEKEKNLNSRKCE
jgi:hypothetical protein